MRAVLLAASLLSLFALAACGKKGPPSPPGPADQITYPKGYPTPAPRSPSGTSPPAQWPFGITPSTEEPQ
jgi:predicted small lipoprotein YifL